MSVVLQKTDKPYLRLYCDGSHSFHGTLEEALDNGISDGVTIAQVIPLKVEQLLVQEHFAGDAKDPDEIPF